MRVLVTGAYGLIGAACLARLHRDGHEVIGAGRVDRAGASGACPMRSGSRPTSAADARRRLAAAARRHRRGGQLRRRAAGRHARRRAAHAGRGDQRAVRRLRARRRQARGPHLGDRRRARTAPTAFARSKAEAEDDLSRSSTRLGDPAPGAGAGAGGLWRHRDAARARRPAVASRRWSSPTRASQVVSVDDVADDRLARLDAASAGQGRVGRCASGGAARLAEIVTAIRDWLGFPPRRPVWRVPHGLGTVVAAVADRSAISAGAAPRARPRCAQLAAGVVGEPAPWIAATGIEPKSLDDDPGAAAGERAGPLVRAAVSVQAGGDRRARAVLDRSPA